MTSSWTKWKSSNTFWNLHLCISNNKEKYHSNASKVGYPCIVSLGKLDQIDIQRIVYCLNGIFQFVSWKWKTQMNRTMSLVVLEEKLSQSFSGSRFILKPILWRKEEIKLTWIVIEVFKWFFSNHPYQLFDYDCISAEVLIYIFLPGTNHDNHQKNSWTNLKIAKSRFR